MEYTVNIPEWQLKDVDNTLRLVSNAFESSKKETCLDRCVVQAQEYVKKALAVRVPSSPVMSKQEFIEKKLRFTGHVELNAPNVEMIDLLYEGYLIGTRSIVPEMTDEEIEKAAKELAKESTAPDKETPNWMLADIERGLKFYRNWLRSQINK